APSCAAYLSKMRILPLQKGEYKLRHHVGPVELNVGEMLAHAGIQVENRRMAQCLALTSNRYNDAAFLDQRQMTFLPCRLCHKFICLADDPLVPLATRQPRYGAVLPIPLVGSLGG